MRWFLLVIIPAIYLAGCDNGSNSPSDSSSLTAVNVNKDSSTTDNKVTQDLNSVSSDYDPLAFAREHANKLTNPEAVIPPQCYTKTDGQFNPCWVCHVEAQGLNHKSDWSLQKEYAFSDAGLKNQWSNLFTDFSADISKINDEAMLSYIQQDNYTPFKEAISRDRKYAVWKPDVDLHAGFDKEGFAVDGSWWRAFRYKPFLGTFWPTNGATDDVMIRLPKEFYTDSNGNTSKAIYKINLAIIEASLASGPGRTNVVDRVIEPIDETIAGIDLNGDGQLSESVTRMVKIPEFFVGAASKRQVRRNLYPRGVEFLHTVRYLDPEQPNFLSKRMKEVRYSIKYKETDRDAVNVYYEKEENNKDENILPRFQGVGYAGFVNEIGWRFQGFIENKSGQLRAQTDQEHYFCMGCHSNIGVTADQTFGFPRKVPGSAGWGAIDYAGIPDVPQLGHSKPEILTYFERLGGGDEFRNNDEIIERFFENGQVNEAEVLRASVDGDLDIRHLILPSKQRAYALNKAYMVLVEQQRFEQGRDPIIKTPENVFAEIEEVSAGFSEEQIYRDGTIWLDWSGTEYLRDQ